MKGGSKSNLNLTRPHEPHVLCVKHYVLVVASKSPGKPGVCVMTDR